MAKRTSLKAAITKPDAGQAAEVARKLAQPTGQAEADYSELMETVSYHLPVEIIEEVTELASLRLRRDKRDRRAAKLAGEKPEGQARRSGSAVVREALSKYRADILSEIEELKKELGAG